jgi:hypothetical protein
MIDERRRAGYLFVLQIESHPERAGVFTSLEAIRRRGCVPMLSHVEGGESTPDREASKCR